jgi:hypothetical protein
MNAVVKRRRFDGITGAQVVRNFHCKAAANGLSPVPLHATFRGDEQHVVTANVHSKAVLRVAAEEFARRCSGVYYFPSFEVVTTSCENPWKADQRHVSETAIRKVMTLFHKMFDK